MKQVKLVVEKRCPTHLSSLMAIMLRAELLKSILASRSVSCEVAAASSSVKPAHELTAALRRQRLVARTSICKHQAESPTIIILASAAILHTD